jgi:SAM-dependent methyltransferase
VTARAEFDGNHLIDVMDEARNYNRYLLDAVVGFAGAARTVLDFGAGNGRLAGALHDRGFAVHAVEPDPELRARLAERGIPTYADLDALGDARFDYVVSLNVLEHCDDDAAVVRRLHAHLVPGGRCLLYVPALMALWTANDTLVGHRRRYTRAGLVRLLEDAGFRVEDARYQDSLGAFAALAYRAFGRSDGEITAAGVRLYDRVLFPVSRACDVLAHRLAGKNLLLRARRPG